jgi:methionyl-tRNA formyltransferase
VTGERPAIAALPGAVAKDDTGGKLWARCGDGVWIEISELQPAGKRRMSAQDFLRGNPIPPDARFGGETA